MGLMNDSLDRFRMNILDKTAPTFLEKTKLNKSSSCLWGNRPDFISGKTKKLVQIESGES